MHTEKQKLDTTLELEQSGVSHQDNHSYSNENTECRFPDSGVVQKADEKRSNRTGMPDRLKSGLENLSGYDLSSVRVHYNSPNTRQIGALAYTQGTNIHIGPGQQKHLPHEGWHAVQQMQGRVKPTMQMKGNVNINDDASLEKEADAMGENAMALKSFVTCSSQSTQRRSTIQIPSSPIVQRLVTAREPSTRSIYSVSNNGKVATGMVTPNHELYVKDKNDIERINLAMAASPLIAYDAGTMTLFTNRFSSVGLRFKAPPQVDEETVTLASTYQNTVKPSVEKFREDLRTKYITKASKGVGDVSPSEAKEINLPAICQKLRAATNELELFKKLIQTTLGTAKYDDNDTKAVEAAFELVSGMESALYSRETRQITMSFDLQKVEHLLEDPILFGIPDDDLIIETIERLRSASYKLHSALPAGVAVDLISFHGVNFQAEALTTSRSANSNILLYRACDVMASTVLGNEVTLQNQDQLKAYGAGGNSGAFHYAAKILTTGDDWVSLESFAASERDREIIGVEDFRNLDQTWQFIMYGSVVGNDKSLSDEDRAFEVYTKIRYYLKGIKDPGTFRKSPREKLIPKPIQSARLKEMFTEPTGIFSRIKKSATQQAEALMTLLKRIGVLDQQGRWTDPLDLTLKKLTSLLNKSYKSLAPKIMRILHDSMPSPHIQLGASSDAANAAGWFATVGASEEEVIIFLQKQMSKATEAKNGPSQVSKAMWDQLASDVTVMAKKYSKSELTESQPTKPKSLIPSPKTTVPTDAVLPISSNKKPSMKNDSLVKVDSLNSSDKSSRESQDETVMNAIAPIFQVGSKVRVRYHLHYDVVGHITQIHGRNSELAKIRVDSCFKPGTEKDYRSDHTELVLNKETSWYIRDIEMDKGY